MAAAEKKRDTSTACLETLNKLLEFLEAIAEEKNIELENAPRRMLEDLNGFCIVINEWVNEEEFCVSF